MELKEGMYCYEKNNRKAGIGKISAFEKHQNVVIVYKKVIRLVTIGNVEASYNILDIIKVGDYVNGEKVGTISESSHSSTTFHYDRGGQGYPEGYDSKAASAAGVSKSGNYGRDGGKVGTITIEGEAKPIVIRFETSGNSLTQAVLFHWCLKPTADCY